MKSGFITIAGKPNAGKSTLMNALVGEKVSIVSPRPQTTRDKINGIMNGDGYQAVFVDTPGIHKPKNALSEYMVEAIKKSLDGVDIIIYVSAFDKKVDEHDEEFIDKYASLGRPFILALNKCDEVGKDAIVERINHFSGKEGITAIIPISALKGRGVDELKEEIVKLLPEGAKFYDEELYTDKTVRFMTAEIIREKAMRNLSDEVPFGIGINIVKFYTRDDGIVEINCDIICEKSAHKPIIIGRGGDMLKKIGSSARRDIEELVGGKVFLTLFVKVREDWRDSPSLLNELGYNKKNLKD